MIAKFLLEHKMKKDLRVSATSLEPIEEQQRDGQIGEINKKINGFERIKKYKSFKRESAF